MLIQKLIEGNSFINELGGAQKQKESLFGLIRSVNSLRENFGKVYVNIGEPIPLEPLLDAANSDWRKAGVQEQERPPWVGKVIDELGEAIMSGIPAAAAASNPQ